MSSCVPVFSPLFLTESNLLMVHFLSAVFVACVVWVLRKHFKINVAVSFSSSHSTLIAISSLAGLFLGSPANIGTQCCGGQVAVDQHLSHIGHDVVASLA